MRALIFVALVSAMPAYASDVDALLDEAANRYNIPAEIVRAVAEVESTKTCGLKDGPHRGIMQVSRSTAREVGHPWPFKDCYEEIEAGVSYLKLALERGGYGCEGISLYNLGINASPICTSYGRKVMREFKK